VQVLGPLHIEHHHQGLKVIGLAVHDELVAADMDDGWRLSHVVVPLCLEWLGAAAAPGDFAPCRSLSEFRSFDSDPQDTGLDLSPRLLSLLGRSDLSLDLSFEFGAPIVELLLELVPLLFRKLAALQALGDIAARDLLLSEQLVALAQLLLGPTDGLPH